MTRKEKLGIALMLLSIFMGILYSPAKDLIFLLIFICGVGIFGWDQHDKITP